MLLSIYGFEMDVPQEYYIFITKDSLHYRGGIDVTDHLKHSFKILWDEIDSFKSRYGSPADFFKEKVEAIRNDKDLVTIDSEEYVWPNAGDHAYHFHKISYSTKKRFTKELHSTIIGMAVACEESARYFLLFHEYSEDKNEFEGTARQMIKSFKCNCKIS